MKDFSTAFKNVRWSVAFMLVVGIVIGVIATWLVAGQIDRIKASNIALRAQETRMVAVDTDGKITTNFPEGSSYKVNILEFEKQDPVTLSKESIQSLFLRVTTNTEMLTKFLSSADEVVLPGEEGMFSEYSVSEIISDVWRVGKITSDEHKGSDVYVIKSEGLGEMGSSYNYDVAFFDNAQQKLVLFEREKEREWIKPENSVYSLFVITPESLSGISGLGLRGRIELDNGKMISSGYIYQTNAKEGMYIESKSELNQIGKTKEGQPVYEGSDSCVLLKDSVGRLSRYKSVIDSSLETNDDSGKLSIKWNAGILPKNDGFNTYQWGGCGGAYGCSILAKDLDQESLVEVGKTLDGDSVFMPKDLAADPVAKIIYDTWYSGSERKPSIQEMITQEPVPFFYWKDAFGRWVRYNNSSLMPVVECGKPVIYLYPEMKTDIRVTLPKFINVTVSEPTYPKNGWMVTANPNGDLVSHADGKTYESLFWEGTGVGYQAPSTGFVVKRENVGSFFASTLPKYGLNQKESQEFMDFWIPRMASSSYYQVSFLTDAWSKAAPLNVSPRPKTNIRIFMDLKPLAAPISIKEPAIITPVRNGFTLVEWGGLLYK